jgi:hypothetical protein
MNVTRLHKESEAQDAGGFGKIPHSEALGEFIPRLAAEPIPVEVQVYSLPVPLFRAIKVAVLANALQVPAVFAFLDLLKGVDLLPPQSAA